jgi:DNA-binding NarL/FixJ family response regulator
MTMAVEGQVGPHADEVFSAAPLRADQPAPAYVVAVIDDQPITRSGMERLVAEQPRFTVAASVASADQLDTAGEAGGYDVAILALPPRPRGSGADTISSVAKIAHAVVVSTWDGPAALSNAVRAGARGCVTRHSDQEEILTALATVAAGGFYLSAALVDQFQTELGRAAREAAVGLAPREIETIRWIALGFTQSQIATRMGLSQATVNTYAKRIRSKLHVTNKAELTRIAIQLGYLADDRPNSAA